MVGLAFRPEMLLFGTHALVESWLYRGHPTRHCSDWPYRRMPGRGIVRSKETGFGPIGKQRPEAM